MTASTLSTPARGGQSRMPKLLDLFCGAGGAARGYQLAGFDVIGIDVAPHGNHYPGLFYQDDALWILERLPHRSASPLLHDVVAVHASPPCQASCALTKGTNQGREYEQMIPATRAALEATGLPYIIENVQGSELRRDATLCGEMFGLGVIRHRYFETNWPVAQPVHKPHRGRVRGWRHGTYYDGPYVAVYGDGGGKGSVVEWKQAMGIDWTEDRKAIAEAIPPAYTEHIGTQLMTHLEQVAA